VKAIEVSNFRATLGQSFRSTNRQLPVLFQNSFALAALLFLESLPGVGLLALSIVFGQLAIYAQVVAVIYLLYVFIRYNGALAYLLAAIPQNKSVSVMTARREGVYFLLNAYKTGVLVLMGQMFLVCACFLVLSNFIFSPYLYIYEGLKGEAAEKRSVALARGNGWRILNWTVIILLLNYTFFVLAFLLLATVSYSWIVVLLVIMVLYLGLLQSNFVRIIYLDLLASYGQKETQAVAPSYKFIVIASIIFVVLIYFILKIWSFYIQ
jgi:hypothetical protein